MLFNREFSQIRFHGYLTIVSDNVFIKYDLYPPKTTFEDSR